jgi:hypothetical protein
MDYLDPIKSVYSVPYTVAKRGAIMYLCLSLAYVGGAGPSILINDFAAIPFNAIACVWTGPIADISIPYSLFAFLYVVFTEKPLFPVVVVSMILVYCHSFKPDQWSGFWASVGIGVALYLFLRRVYGNRAAQ